MHWTEEIYFSFVGSVPFLGIPALAGRAYRDPDTFTKKEIAISLGSSTVIGYALGKFVPNMAEFKQYKFAKTAQLIGRGLVVTAPVTVPAMVATATAVGYEKSVNETIRSQPGHSNAGWRGPFASGFGSVV